MVLKCINEVNLKLSANYWLNIQEQRKFFVMCNFMQGYISNDFFLHIMHFIFPFLTHS